MIAKKRKSILFVSIVLALVIIGSSLAVGCGGTKLYTIGITSIVTHPALDANKQGFIDALADAGYVEGENVTYIDKSPEGDMTLAATIAKQFVDEEVDLILAIATPTAQACVAATERAKTNIPVIFGSVTDPVAAELITNWEKPGGNVTGISDWLEIPSQIQMVLDIMPNLDKIGVVYNSGETNSVVQVDALKAAAPGLGISVVVEGTASSTAEVKTAAESLIGRVDAIWVGTDNTVVAAFEALVKVCEDNNIPLFASDVDSVERGAIAALGMDYYEVGVSCGELAIRILEGGNPGDISAQKVNLADLELYVNPGAATLMGITIPQSVIDAADQIVE
ncbi:ABC transporter substrate-binding protein [Chloroflexota bacterium]